MPLRDGTSRHRAPGASASAAASRCACELVLRFDYGAIVPVGDAPRRRHAARDRRARHGACCARRCALRGEDMTHGRRVQVAAGETSAVRADLRPFASAIRRRRSIAAAMRSNDTEDFWRDWSARCTVHRARGRERGHALADHAEGADLRADRRHRRRADHLAARAARRRAQLGLPLLLAARRDAHAARADERRLLRGGAAPGATGCCARSPAARSRCRSCTASPASGG